MTDAERKHAEACMGIAPGFLPRAPRRPDRGTDATPGVSADAVDNHEPMDAQVPILLPEVA